MDVNGASNLREKVKTEKDVKTEYGVERRKGKKKKNKMQNRLEANQGEGKFERGFFAFAKKGSTETSKRSNAADTQAVLVNLSSLSLKR